MAEAPPEYVKDASKGPDPHAEERPPDPAPAPAEDLKPEYVIPNWKLHEEDRP